VNKNRTNRELLNLKEVRLLDSDGSALGIFTAQVALQKAEEKELDLVEIAPNAKPPVAKIIDYGKFVYEQQKRDKIQKKKQHVTILKEIRLHPNTDTHDLDFKARHAIGFLEEGNKVKISVVFKGRELAYKDHGRKLLEKFLEKFTDIAKTEYPIKFEGRAMHTIIASHKSKKN
jgi:translation initiation factor IF-3